MTRNYLHMEVGMTAEEKRNWREKKPQHIVTCGANSEDEGWSDRGANLVVKVAD